MLHITTLGGLAIDSGEEPVSGLASRKAEALLVYLAASGRPQARELLADLLWDDRSQRQAMANLRVVLSSLRKQLGPYVSFNRETAGLNPEAQVWLDAAELAHRLAPILDGRGIASAELAAQVAAGVALYRGEFLAGFHLRQASGFEEWLTLERESIRQRVITALHELVSYHLRQASYDTGISFARQLLGLHPYEEKAHQNLMRLLAYSGRRQEALAQYELCRQVLQEELGIAPSPDTEALLKEIREGELAAATPRAGAIRGYKLQARIGAGSFGAVYRAYQPAVGREVAIKAILPRYANDPAFIRRFEAEAQVIAQLEHPHIVPLYDFWREPDGAYLVMRWLRGGSLKDALEGGGWELEPAAALVEQVASALTAVHRRGVVHRDLKPANILLDEGGRAYLSDFGIAKDLGNDRSGTATGALLGTPSYLSPEQALGEAVTPRTDLYSLGVVLYELLTGQAPFRDSPLPTLIYKHIHELLPLVSQVRPDLPPAVDRVIQRATAKMPGERYADATALATAFRAAVQGADGHEPGLAVDVISPAVDLPNPYKGLRAFQESDASLFFGREALVEQLLARFTPPAGLPQTALPVSPAAGRFLAVVGPSGSGKSSVVKAGLIPALRQGGVEGSERWFMVEMIPGTHPFEELEAALLRVAVNPPDSLLSLLREDERGLARAAKQILPGDEQERLLLLVDQFEELFTLVDDVKSRELFLDSLAAAVSDPRGRVNVLVTLRADFYDRPLLHPGFSQLVRLHTEVVTPMTTAELAQAIRRPAELVGVGLEEALVTAVIGDVDQQPGGLPLMQYALTELFEGRQDGRLTQAAYARIGGVGGALGRRAEELFANLDERGQEAARQLFLRLVSLGEGVEDTRRRVQRSEIMAMRPIDGAEAAGVLDTVIDAYGRYRLLTFDHDPATREPTVEIAHEALLREWPRLRGWLEESRADVRQQRLLAQAAAEWGAAGREGGYLLRGARLEQFAGWAEGATVALTGEEAAFLQASLAARERREAEEEARRQRELETAQKLAQEQSRRAEEQAHSAGRLRRRAYVLGGVLVLAVLLAVAALFFAQQSNDNAQAAEANALASQENADLAATREAEALASEAEAITQKDRADEEAAAARSAETEALLAQEEAQAEAEIRATAEAIAVEQQQEALRQAGIGLASQAELQMIGTRPERAVLLALEALEKYPYTWQAERALGQAVLNHHLIADLDHGTYVNHADISPDGTRIATGADDGVTKVWDITTGELIHTLPGHENWVFRVFWSPSGDRILTASPAGTARVWDVETGQQLFVLTPGGYYAFWSPDETRILVSGRPDGTTVEVFDATSGEHLFSLSHGATNSYPGWSPDGKRIVTTSDRGEAKVWDATTGLEIATIPLSGHEGFTPLTFFSPDGTRVLTSNKDHGTATVWDVNTGEELLNFSGSTIMPAAFWSPSGDRILTRSRDTLRVWDGESGEELLALSAPAFPYAYWSPDGSLIAAGGVNGQIKVWDSVSGRVLLDIVGHDGEISDAGWSPDGQAIWTTGGNGHAKVWKVSNKLLDIPEPDDAWSSTPAWSPSGESVARGFTGAVIVWDVSTGSEVLRMTFEPRQDLGLSGVVIPVDWSPRGDRLLSGDTDGFLRVWSTTTGGELLTLTAHGDWIWEAAWSPDGNRFVSASGDGTAKVWDADSGELLLTFDKHIPDSASWSPDGSKIVTASLEDNSAIVWDANTGEVLSNLFPEDFEYGVSTAVFSPDGTRIATFGLDRVGRIWDADSGKLLLSFAGPAGAPKVSWSPSGDYLLAADSGIQIWEARTGNQLLSIDTGTNALASWSPDGSRIAAGGGYGSLQVYQVWRSSDELLDMARNCCVIRELTAEERVQFGLPPQ